MVTENNTYSSFKGKHEFSVDQKNRLNIPAPFRKALNPVNENTFTLTRGMDRCILAIPREDFKKIEISLRSLNRFKKKYRNAVRELFMYATDVKVDLQGRIKISDELKKFANVSKEVIIIGNSDKIEIWDPHQLDTIDECDDQDVSAIFEELPEDINFI